VFKVTVEHVIDWLHQQRDLRTAKPASGSLPRPISSPGMYSGASSNQTSGALKTVQSS
jgi:hypothetical protein